MGYYGREVVKKNFSDFAIIKDLASILRR